MSPISDLGPSITNINVAEDVRGPAIPVTGSPFTVTTTAATVLQTNTSRATASIINSGSATVLLKEGSTPTITTTNYTLILPPNRMWEPSENFRFTAPVQALTASGTTTLVVSESVILL